MSMQSTHGAMRADGEDDMPIEVLLVEDSPGDVRLTQEAFRDANRSHRLHVASDGADAMAFLRREGRHGNAPRPDFILLDLNLPKMDGREVLAQIKADESLKIDPDRHTDNVAGRKRTSRRAISFKRTAFSPNRCSWSAFESLVRSINDFWLTTVRLPRRPESGQE